MRRLTATGCVLVIVLLWLAGCQTLGDVIHEKSQGGGTVQVYPVDTDEAWDIAKIVFRWEVGGTIEEHRAEGFMLTGSPPTAFTWGGVMGAWIEPVGPVQTQVTVVTKRSLATTVATPLTEATFHKRFAQAVGIVKAGQPLPLTPPEYPRSFSYHEEQEGETVSSRVAPPQERQPIAPPPPGASPPLAVPQQGEQPPIPGPPSSVPQPVPQQAERQPAASLQRKAKLDVVQVQLQYNPAPLLNAPDTHAEKRGIVYPGVALKIIEERDAWLYVESPFGRRGWILREWIQQ